MSFQNILSIIAGVLSGAGFIPYILAIFRGKTKPMKASWIIWATLDTIVFAGMYAKNTVNGQIIGTVAGIWIVVALALKYGTPGWTRLDKFCVGGAIIGIGLWQILNNPVLGIMISLGVASLGSIPTFLSAWKDPRRENKLAWTIFWISDICAVTAIPHWTLADAAQPIIFLINVTIIMLFLFVPFSYEPVTS